MNVSLRMIVSFGAAVCLLPGVLALSGCSSAPTDDAASTDEPAVQQQEAPTYTVNLPDLTGAELMDRLAADAQLSDAASIVTNVSLSVDTQAGHVDLTVSAVSSDVEQLCTAAEAVAQCLSDQATVTTSDGAAVSDNGPCGALFEAYSLSIRVQGMTDADVFDGVLPAGGDEVNWQ